MCLCRSPEKGDDELDETVDKSETAVSEDASSDVAHEFLDVDKSASCLREFDVQAFNALEFTLKLDGQA